MNTINIFLKPTGSVAELQKDFPIYVGSYKTNYVKVYVLPTMMPVVENVNYGLALSGKFTLDNGSDFVAEPTWLEALPDETITSRNVETTYKVFGTYLPRKLCSYAGNQTLILNLQSINSVTNEFISVITTQEANVLIQRSAYVLVDETPEPGQYEQINGRVTENEEDILDLQNDITDINTRIDNLPLSEDYIGSFSGTTQPFDDGVITDAMVALLNAEVADIKGESYVKKNGDVLIYTYQITGETDKNYKFIYTTNDTWTGYEIPALEVAGNGSLGIVEGTEGTGSTNDVIVDIGSGQIRNIKFKEGGNYVALNTIPTTYQTKAEGATKTYVREYSLPREFNDIYYLANTGYQKSVPTAPSSGIQYTATSSAVGDTTLFTCSFMNTADFELSAKNSTNNNIYIKATANATLQFRMTTQYRKNGEADWTDLSIELTGDIPFVANQLQKVQFGSAMTELGDDMVVMTNGDQLRQILEVITETSDTISFEIYSNSTYPSIFNLNTQLATLVIGNLLERMEGSEYISVDENESNTKIEFKIPDNKVETSAPQNGSSKIITSGAVYNAIPQIDEVSITENASNKLQASKLKEKDVKIGENSVNKADFNGVVELSEEQYQELLAYGTIIVDGQTISFDETAYYNTPDDGGATQVYTKAETNALLDEKVDKKPDGVNDLIDSNNKITDTYLPDYLLGQLLYGGTFNASTDVATLSDNAKAKLGVSDNTILLTNDTTPVTGYADNEGIFYVTSTTGTFADITFDVGDWLLSSGSAWQRIANTDAVTGVKGNAEENYRIGQVNLTPANIGTYSSSQIDTAVGAKLDKVITSDSNERVYAVDEHGTQEMKTLESGTGMAAPTVNTVVLRGGGGVVSCGTPTQAYHAANKYYVDTYGGKIRKIFVNNTEVPIINNDEVHLTVPTTTNDLTNNSGFITNTVANLANYYLKSETYSKSEVNSIIAGLNAGVNLEIVAVLPTASADTYFNVSKTIYLVQTTASENNYYDEFITIRTGEEGSYVYSWEQIGSTQVDLTNYVQKTFTIAGIDMQDNITTSELKNALGVKFIVTDGKYIEDNEIKTSSGSIAQTGTTVAEDSGWVQPNAEGRGSVAFGRGTVAGGQEDWNNPDDANHDYAFASGKNAKAYGDSSFAANRGTKVTGANAAAFNESTQAQGKDSFSAGYGSIAYDKGAVATGYYTEARGEYSFTANSSDTNGKYAFAANEETRANAEAASSFGRSTQATGANSMATGHLTTAGHTSSFAGGESTKTSKNNQTVVGQYNADDSDALFIVGDGTADNARSNCFEAGADGSGDFIKVGNTRVHESEIRSINGMSGGTLTSQLNVTGGDSSSSAKIAISNASSGQITDEGTHTLFGFTADNADTLTIGHNNYKTNIRGSATRPTYKGDDLALLSDVSGKLDKDTSSAGDARLYGINANGTQAIFTLDYSNTASAGRVPRRSSTGALMINDSTYTDAGQFTDGLQAINKNALITRTTALTGSTAPTTATVGFIGQNYIDTVANKVYMCSAITAQGTDPETYTYTWIEVTAPIAYGENHLGLVQTNWGYYSGLVISNNGTIQVSSAADTDIANRTSNKPIVPSKLNSAVKSALTDANHLTMTSAEQATAQSVLGVDLQTMLSALTGYDASKTQVLKNISGTLTWVDET